MSIMASRIIGNSTVCSTVCSAKTFKALPHWSIVSGIHWQPVDSPHKGSVTLKKIICHDVTIQWPFSQSFLNGNQLGKVINM